MSIIVTGIGFILTLIFYVLLSLGIYKLACKFIEKNPIAAMVISGFGIFLFPIGIFVPIKVWSKIAKYAAQKTREAYAIMSELAQAPTDEKVDAFMARVDNEGGTITNNPDNWNAFRNLWFAVNESPNVTTSKKNLFCMWLRTKGLILSEKQAKIKDNFGK